MRSTDGQGLRLLLTPLHPEGWPFVVVFLAAATLLFLLWAPLGWIGLAATGWCAYFFRNPDRVTPTRPGLIVAAADGVVQDIDSVPPPPALDLPPQPVTRIGVFLSLLDVHVARAPAAGLVLKRNYAPGRFHNAASAAAMAENERLDLRFGRDGRPDLAVSLIAGQVARRIRTDLAVGDRVAAGERIGLIRFGSRVEVYLPAGVAPLVAVGQHMVAGETVIADEDSSEPARVGEVR